MPASALSLLNAVVLGCLIGIVSPETGKAMAPIGKAFVSLITMMIAPVIFCTIVLGVGSIAKAATVGKVGGMALLYFVLMSTFALAIGLVVGNFLHPGASLHYTPTGYTAPATGEAVKEVTGNHTVDFLLNIIPTSLLSSLTSGNILQTLFVALLTGFALQKMGPVGKPILKFLTYAQALIFRLLMMIMWVAPLGALGAIAGVVGSTGAKAIGSMFVLMLGFYITCVLFICIVLGTVLKFGTGVSIFKLMKYLAAEYLLIFSTEVPFDETAMGNDLHGDQYVDDAVARKSPTKQIPVVNQQGSSVKIDKGLAE